MLLNNLYRIISSSKDDGLSHYVIAFNPDHSIYSGHFPGQPITPGACLAKIVMELLSISKGEEIEPKFITNLKFLAPHRPEQQITVEIASTSESCRFIASLYNGVEYYAKMTFVI